MSETAVQEARTATSFMSIKTRETSLITEMSSPQAAPHTMAGDLKDQTGTGDEVSRADAEIWFETGHRRDTGNKKDVGSNGKGTGAEKEMIGMTGVADEVRRENTAGRDMKNEKKREGKETTAVTRKVIQKQRANICLKGKVCKCLCKGGLN